MAAQGRPGGIADLERQPGAHECRGCARPGRGEAATRTPGLTGLATIQKIVSDYFLLDSPPCPVTSAPTIVAPPPSMH